MLLNCAKSCGQCGNSPDLFSACSCEDNNKDCRMWAIDGDCCNEQTYVVNNCKKSCSQCGRVAKVPVCPCIDYHSSCEEWARLGECQRNTTGINVSTICKKSCNLCEEENPMSNPIFSVRHVPQYDGLAKGTMKNSSVDTDEYEEGRGIVGDCPAGAVWTRWLSKTNPYIDSFDYEKYLMDDPNACEHGEAFAIEARVVGSKLPFNSTDDIITKISPNQGLRCFNKYQVDGHCQDYEVRYCCKPVCKDIHEKCDERASKGECCTNSTYMLLNCAKSCGQCGNSPDLSCKDRHEYCAGWAAEGECCYNPNYMLTDCMKSCQHCINNPKLCCPCIDYDKECEDWAEDGECQLYPEFMSKICKKSCGLCTEDGQTEDEDV